MELQENEQLRLKCLELAVAMRSNQSPQEATGSARQFYEYVREPQPTTSGRPTRKGGKPETTDNGPAFG